MSVNRVAHINLSRGYRGGERQTEILIRSQVKELGVKTVVAVVRTKGTLAARLKGISGLTVIQVNSFAHGHFAVGGNLICHAHDAKAVYWAYLHRLIYGSEFVITRRVQDPLSLSSFNRLAYHSASRICAISHAIQDYLASAGLPCNDMIPSVLDSDVNSEPTVLARKLARSNDVTLSVCGALVDSHKGQSVAIYAMRHLPTTYRLNIVGDGKDLDVLVSLVDSLNLQDRVFFFPWPESLDDVLQQTDLGLVPSFHEGLGSIILDYFVRGIPVVASNVGGIPDLVESGVNGALFKAGCELQLAQSVHSIAARPRERERLSYAALEKAQKYTPKLMWDSYQAIYLKLGFFNSVAGESR